MSYEKINSLNFQNGLNVSAPPLSDVSANSLADGTWNAICSADGYVRPWSGATSQGANTGARKMLPFGNTWGGIRDIGYTDNTFLTSSIASDTVTTATAHGWITGLVCQVSTAGTLPTGLAAATNYYLIVMSTTTVKFASSLANALLGTPIAISNAVTSTVTIDVSNSTATASGNFFQDIGLSRWGIGSGQPMIEGVSVPGFALSTNLQVQVAVSGVYGAAIQAGLSPPSAPGIGLINTLGTITNSMSCKIARSRPSTGAVSVASPVSAVVLPQNNRIYVVFPLAQTGQTHWRVFFPFQGFGGVGVHYLGSYLGLTDIPEATVAAGTAGGGVTASGTLTIGTNPADGDTITINAEIFEYKTVVADPSTQILLGANSTATATNTATTLTTYGATTALYTSSANVVTITYSAPGAAGNAFTLASSVSPAKIQLSGATLTGGVDGFARSLEFNFQDGDLIPIEASFDDYAPPAGTHAIRLNTVMNVAGCYADSLARPTTSNPGTCIAVSKENNYESYVPTSLLYLTEQVVDVLARPLDDFGYIGCQNSISAIQYVGNRGDDLPACTITTVLPDIGIQYQQNWCHFRGQLLIYTAQGNLLLMDEQGNFNTTFANPVSKILKTFTTADTSVAYDPKNDSIVVMNGKRILIYSLQAGQWRQIWLPDYSISGTTLSGVAAQRQLYFTMSNSGVDTAYTYDTGSATAPLSFVSGYQNCGGTTVQDIYELAISVQTNVTTKLAVCLNRDLTKTCFRQIASTSSSLYLTDAESTFTPDIGGKSFLLFGTNVGGANTVLLQGTITDYVAADMVRVSVAPSASLTNCLMFVGDWVSNVDIAASGWPVNLIANRVEYRGYQMAVWLQSSGEIGNVLTADLLGTTYPSIRALASDPVFGGFGPRQWFRPEELTSSGYTNGQVITTWVDHSAYQTKGTGNYTNSGVVGSPPVTTPPTMNTASPLNGYPVAQLLTAGQFADTLFWGQFFDLNIGGAGWAAQEMAIVLKHITSGDAIQDGGGGSWQFGNGSAARYSPGGVSTEIHETFGNSSLQFYTSPSSLESWRIYQVYSAANDFKAYLGGAQIFTTATNTVSTGATYLGRSILGGINYFFRGHIAEYILWDRKLLTAERTAVYTYLSEKYGL